VKKNKINIGPGQMRAAFQPGTFDAETRTVDVTWTTGKKGKRFSFSRGVYFEELSLKRTDVNLERLNNGAAVLNNHQSRDLRDAIGVVEKASIKKGEGVATIRFSDREDVQGIVRDIENGIIRNISVGYNVEEYTDVSRKGDEIPTYRATSWTPMEVSFVNIPFDEYSQVRSHEESEETYDVEIVEQEETMKDNNTELESQAEETRSAETVETPKETTTDLPTEEIIETVEETVDRDALVEEGRKVEMKRQSEIRSSVKAAGLADDVAEGMISEDKTVDQAREAIIKTLADKNKETSTRSAVEVNDVNNKQLRNQACSNAIEQMYSSETPEALDGARDFKGSDILEVARRFMESEGIDVKNLSRMDIAKLAIGGELKGEYGQRTHSTSDFPFLLADVTNKSLQRAYSERSQTFAPFTRSRTVSDFKKIQSTQFGDAPVLLEVNEKGEYKHGSISEGKEEYAIAKYGRILSVSERLLLNDDMGSFLLLAEKMGRRARDLESDLVWKQITSNPLMGDGKALFHVDHGNLGSGVIDIANVNSGKVAMRSQVGLDGAKLDLSPEYMVTPVALETTALQFLGGTTPNQDSQVNPFKGTMSNVSEIRLDDDSAVAWYLFASQAQAEMIEIARLRGNESPIIETKRAFEDDAMKIKIKYHFASKVLDWRPFYKSTGV